MSSGARLYLRLPARRLTAGARFRRFGKNIADDNRAMTYEGYDEPLLPLRMFLRRVLVHGAVGLALLVIPLVIGIVGYMGLAGLSPVDAFLNASMILGGMGPVDVLPTAGAKIFAGSYALFAGVFFIAVAGLILSPFLHRVLHRLHVDNDDSTDNKQAP
jgi:hypothetical protein